MPQKSAEEKSSRLLEVEGNVLKLLYHDVSYPGWQYELAQEKCFYIRGLRWLRRVLAEGRMPATRCGKFIPRMKDIVASRAGWHSNGFDWSRRFSPRQFINTISPQTCATLSFPKAVEFLALGEAMLERIHKRNSSRPSPMALYDHMGIEAGASYINKLTVKLLQERYLDGPLADRLRDFTGQSDSRVFDDMADDMTNEKKAQTVTHKLALRVYSVLINSGVKPSEIDPPQFRYDPKHHSYTPSSYETVDLDESTLPKL